MITIRLAKPVIAVGEFASQNPFRFSGQYGDTETGLIYYGYRYYSPHRGTWISRDPSEEAGGINLNGFIENNAVAALTTSVYGSEKTSGAHSEGAGETPRPQHRSLQRASRP